MRCISDSRAFASGGVSRTGNSESAGARIFSREELDPTWVARPIAMARHWGRTVLVLEDPGGAPLDQLLGQPLEVAFSLRLAISLSRAIDHLHQRDIIHKDIKPANVLVNSVTANVR